MLTMDIMQERWPNGDQHYPGLMEGIVAAADTVFPKYGLNSPLTIAHAMAQFSEECGQGLEMIESLNYSVQGLLKIFPTHFTPEMAQRWAHNELMIGQIAYGGRMGNAPPPSTDGFDFRGAGFSQVTGRSGFVALQASLDKHGAGINVLTDPGIILHPDFALECGVADWVVCGCLPCAEKDDVKGVTKALNGGYNGLDERVRQLGLWKMSLGVTPVDTAAAIPVPAAIADHA